MRNLNELTPDEQERLKVTHVTVWPEQIRRETDRSFLCRLLNKRGAWQSVWIPKSRIIYQEFTDERLTLQKDSFSDPVPNPNYKGVRLKYFIPKHFTKVK